MSQTVVCLLKVTHANSKVEDLKLVGIFGVQKFIKETAKELLRLPMG